MINVYTENSFCGFTYRIARSSGSPGGRCLVNGSQYNGVIEFDRGHNPNVQDGHSTRFVLAHLGTGTAENSQQLRTVCAHSGSLQSFWYLWLQCGDSTIWASGNLLECRELSGGTHGRGCTLIESDVFICGWPLGGRATGNTKHVIRERGCTRSDELFVCESAEKYGINEWGCTFCASEIYFNFWSHESGLVRNERGCTRRHDRSFFKSTSSSGSYGGCFPYGVEGIGFLALSGTFTSWLSENSMVACSGSLNPHCIGLLEDDLTDLDLFEPFLDDWVKQGDRVRNEWGCTRIVDTFTETAIRCSCDAGKTIRRQHSSYTVEPWFLRLMLSIQCIGHSYLICLQFVMIILSRLLFLKFDRSHCAGICEVGWQLARGIFWAVVTVVIIWKSKKPQLKRLVIVNRSRYCVCVRRRVSPRLRYLLWACLVIHTHAIPAIKVLESQHEFILEHSDAFGIKTMDGGGHCSDEGDQLTDPPFAWHPSPTPHTDDAVTNKHSSGLDPGWQSHVFDRWCVVSPGTVLPCGEPESPEDVSMIDDVAGISEATFLLQVTSSILLARVSIASFTDEFLDLAWPLTSQGDRDLAASADIDPERLRMRWQTILARNNIPRPINVASYTLHRPPYARSSRPTFTFSTSRFDDPFVLPGVVEAEWPDLQMSSWRFYQCHSSITSSRTWDDDSWHFILLVGREQSIFGFPTGIIEIVSRFNEDECTFAYSATIPAYATWAHLWSWLGIGNDFNAGTIYQIQVNGENVIDPIAQLSIAHGFFVQIFATMSTAEDHLTLPAERYRRLQGDLCFSLPSGHGKVYKAGITIHDTEIARLPYRDRTEAILSRWPALSVWTMFKTHQTARGRSPPWAAMDDAVIIQENPDGMHVAVLCVVYDGSGPSEYALVLHRHSTAYNLYSILEIVARCLSPRFGCHTSVNMRTVGPIDPLNLEEGDFVEVVIVSHDERQMAAHSILCADDEAASSTLTTTCVSIAYTSHVRQLSTDPLDIDVAMTADLHGNDIFSKSFVCSNLAWSNFDLGISLLQLRAAVRRTIPDPFASWIDVPPRCETTRECCLQPHPIVPWRIDGNVTVLLFPVAARDCSRNFIHNTLRPDSVFDDNLCDHGTSGAINDYKNWTFSISTSSLGYHTVSVVVAAFGYKAAGTVWTSRLFACFIPHLNSCFGSGKRCAKVYTRSFVISRHHSHESSLHPIWNVDDPFSNYPLRARQHDVKPHIDVQCRQPIQAEESRPHVRDRWCVDPLRPVGVVLAHSGLWSLGRGHSYVGSFLVALWLWMCGPHPSDIACQSPLLFSHSPFSRLPPPGNGIPICLAEHLGLCEDQEGAANKQEQVMKVNRLPVVDLRTNRVDVLEDFHISDTVITVHDFIPTTVPGNFPVQFTFDSAWSLLTPWPSNFICPLDESMTDMPSIGQAFVQAAQPFNFDDLRGVTLYVDGSAYSAADDSVDSQAAFALVIVGEQSEGYSVVGYVSGEVITDPSWPSWMGATSENAMEAERCGLVLAILWSLQWDGIGDHEVLILFDNQAAGFGASGQWHIDPSSLLSLVTRDLAQSATEAYGHLLQFSHVKGHSNNPGNELADFIAKQTAIGKIQASANQLDHRALLNAIKHDGPFCWLSFAAALGKRDLPDVFRSFPCCRALPNQLDEHVLSFAPCESHSQALAGIRLQLGSINVRSLFDDRGEQDGRIRFVEKAKYIADQLSWSNYHIIGLQETCTRTPGVSRVSNYHRLAGGCNSSGQLGCEIWVDSCLDGSNVPPDSLVLLHGDPRRLLARLQVRGIDIIFAVLHAPHKGHGSSDVEEWWLDTTNLCSSFRHLAPLCVLADSNAQLSLPHPPNIGDLLDGTESLTSPLLVDFCHLCDLWLPSTFADVHTGDNGTWHHHSGLWVRIDYIGLPMSWKMAEVHSWTDGEIDLNQTTADHRVIGCSVQYVWQRTSVPRKKQLDYRYLADADIQNRIQEALLGADPIPWETDVQTHAWRIKTLLHDTFAQHIPQLKSKPRASYISESTWHCRQAKGIARKQLKCIWAALTMCWRLWAFAAWKTGHPLQCLYRPHLKWLFHWECRSAKMYKEIALLTSRLRSSIRQDRLNFIDNCAKKCQTLPLHLVFQELRQLGVGAKFRKTGPRVLPQFRQANGDFAHDTSEIAEAWRLHCERLEAGEAVDRLQLLHWVHGTNHHRGEATVLPSQIPSRVDLERHLRRMACSKARGCDQIPSDACHHLPASLSRLLYPLLLKESLLLEEPLEHKGGRLVYMYKGKGPLCDTANFRGLMITSVLGKSIRSSFREKVLPKYRSYTGNSYYSARQFGHVGQAAMALRLFAKSSKDGGYSTAMAFLDIKSAYYRVCRELATGFSGHDHQICHILKHFDMPPSALEELHHFLQTIGGAMEDAQCGRFHQDLMSELCNGSWFVVDNSKQLTQTHGGTRPGDGLADMLFGFIFGRLLRQLKEELVAAHLWDSRLWEDDAARNYPLTCGLTCSQIPSTLDVVWADDLALAIREADAASCVAKIQAILDQLFSWCYRFGLEPNTAKGKSEVLLQLRGGCSRQIKATLFDCQDPHLDIQTDHGQNISIHLVASYKHLGGVHYVGGKLLKDVRIRCGMMASAFNRYNKKVFANKHVPILQKSQLLESMVFSISRWNLGSWHSLDQMSFRRFCSSSMHLAKRICLSSLGKEVTWSLTDNQILAKLQMSSPQEALYLARLSFFTTAYHTAPTGLWMLIAAERSWREEIDRALQWLHSQLHGSTPYHLFHEFVQAWLDGVKHRGKHWKGWIQRAKRHAIMQRINAVLVQDWHSMWYDQLADCGFSLPAIRPILLADSGSCEFFCGPCRRVFRTKAAWSTHSRKKHNRLDPLRYYISDARCRACGGFYHTTRRLLAHLNYDRQCARAHVALSSKQEPLPGRGARREDAGPDLPIPVRRPRVPFQFVADDYGDEMLLCDQTFINDLRGCVRSHSDVTTCTEAIRDLLRSSVVSTDDAWEALAAVSHETETSVVGVEALHFVSLHWSISWIFADDASNIVWPDKFYSDLHVNSLKADIFKPGQTLKVIGPAVLPPPPKCHREIFVINFFSGVRRHGDIQFWITSAEAPPGCLVTAISVDIIFDKADGDLTCKRAQEKWLSFLRRATVAGTYFGPPCNTWSVSRWRAVTHGDKGPRPVRTVAEPFGEHSLRLKELRDVTLGNQLLFFALEVTLLQALLFRVAVLEHPAPPDPARIPSIWFLNATHAIKQLANYTEVMIFQGLFGAVSPKPTCLGITSCTDPAQRLASFETTSVMPPPLKMGRGGQGREEFTTAQLKEYPEGLSRGLAQLSIDWWTQSSPDAQECTDGVVDTSSSDFDFVRPFTVLCTEVYARGADTRGRGGF